MRRRVMIALVIPALLYAGTPAGSAAAGPPRSFTIAAAGDILIHGRVMRRAAEYAGGDGYDFRPMLAPTEPWIAEADLAICHLEGTLSSDNTGLSGYPFFVAPHEVADAIAAAGYDTCSLAGNHALDRGDPGLYETIEILEEAGIAHEGTARSAEERLPNLYDLGGITVGHLDYTYALNGAPLPESYSVNVIDAEAILADAAWAREHGADFVVLTIHWGEEYRVSPAWWQEDLAEQLTASPDLDLILGTHVHVVQPIGRVNAKVVVYGMGNHLSNQFTAYGFDYVGGDDGIIVHVTVTEQADGRFAVSDVAYTPTMVELDTYRVLPVAHARAAGLAPDHLLAASWERTIDRVNRLGTTGLETTPGEWPPLLCAGSLATVWGTSGADLLAGTPGNDVIVGRGGADAIWGSGGNDLICGGDGADHLWGGSGWDTLWGDAGDDTLFGDPGHDILRGGVGNDLLWGGGDTDALYGGDGDDSLHGGSGDDVLVAGSGTDNLFGERGADVLLGSPGRDLLDAGAP